MIECRDLTKKYNDLFAVDRLTLRLEQGDVYGFIGPNGSGKTTTMRMLATLLNPSWGEATVCGYSIYTGAKQIRRLIGYMPDFFGVYDDMKVTEYLEFFAAAYRIDGPARRRRVEQVLDYVDLGYKRDALVTSLSRGMTQRLGLARTLLHDPQVLLLDEPASGLDPRARIEMRELIKRLRRENKTIMVSSHILPELADICNKIGIIERGKLIWNGTVEAAIQAVRGKSVFTVAVLHDRNAEAAERLRLFPEVESVTPDPKTHALDVRLRDGYEDGSFIPERLLQAGFRLRLFKEKEVNIEDVFMRITKGITS
ncbi:MAG: ABC transporter ATP-binding protein [Thermogemmata sp.]|jgi:ABC-2 type transport system ATP-binding protein|uniref:ABC transporter ATP-binding protein n=1 Tax=Thermogemmata fonticola TaxID=2755323 RepID=A0A7V9ACM7_9BACT|nr:ABC transporter ATP-binding protein [Thermogemmata fonticola]MBA2227199.1 ABC transporter ATP-binding protein [Thermogemmata fonticola]